MSRLRLNRRPAPAAESRPRVPVAEGDRRCLGRTKSDQQCRLWRAKGSSFCRAHHPADPPAILHLGEGSNRPVPNLRPRGTVAAVARINFGGASWKHWPINSREWQREAWRLYDITGPLRFVVNSVAKTASKAKLFVGEVDDSGDIHVETQDLEVAELAKGPLGSGESRAEAIRLLCINLQVAGEAYVIAEGFDQTLNEPLPDNQGRSVGGFRNVDENGNPRAATLVGPDGDDADRWYVVSSEQITLQGDQVIIRRPTLMGGGYFTPVDKRDILMRIWVPHPVDIDEPDSPVRSAIPDLRELEALRKREFAELDSRLAGAGIFAVPDNMDFPRGDADDDTESESGLDGFLADLGNAMSESLQDRSSAAAMVPIGIQGPADALKEIRHITFWTELSEAILPMKDSALKMTAMSLDAPVEMMQGMGQTNHWSAWLLDENTISTHIEPLLGLIADGLTRAWLMPVLKRIGRDPKRFSYKFNTSSLQVRGDKTTTALELHERRLISDAALREVTDFDDALAPSAEERLRRMVEDAIRVAPSTMMMDPDVRRILGLNPEIAYLLNPSIDTDSSGNPLTDEGRKPPPPSGNTENVEEEREVPDPERELPEEPEREDDGGRTIPSGLVACCNLAVLRALELAGGRLVPNRPRDAARHELHTWAEGVSRDRAEWALKGSWTHLAPVVRSLGVQDVSGLETLLHQYCVELIMRGVAHHSDLLEQVLARALAGAQPPARELP
jgi:hypothetical protein